MNRLYISIASISILLLSSPGFADEVKCKISARGAHRYIDNTVDDEDKDMTPDPKIYKKSRDLSATKTTLPSGLNLRVLKDGDTLDLEASAMLSRVRGEDASGFRIPIVFGYPGMPQPGSNTIAVSVELQDNEVVLMVENQEDKIRTQSRSSADTDKPVSISYDQGSSFRGGISVVAECSVSK